jgi:hypothetical protein
MLPKGSTRRNNRGTTDRLPLIGTPRSLSSTTSQVQPIDQLFLNPILKELRTLNPSLFIHKEVNLQEQL